MLRRITQKDIAQAAHVHPATVSLALRGHASIPTATRRKIERLARRLGYQADPLLHALADYRSRNRDRRPRRYSNLALVDNWPGGMCWHARADHTRTRRAVLDRARELGFEVQEFHLGTDPESQRRCSRRMLQLGIHGVIVAPQPPDPPGLALDWKHFTLVNLGNRLIEPVLHCSMPDIFANYRILVKTLLERGYRRLGTYFPLLVGAENQEAYSALFLGGNILSWRGNRMFFAEPLLLDEWSPDRFLHWVEANALDVIATSEPQIPDVLRHAGYDVPGRIGVAYTPCRTHPTASGVYTLEENIGATAVDLLQTQLQLGRTGLPEYPLRVSHPGLWVDGDTIRTA